MDCVCICYALNSSTYKFLVHKSEIPYIHVNMIIESRDVLFEDIFPYKRKENLTSEKRTHETIFRDDVPVNRQSIQKLNQEAGQDRESLNPLVQTS